MNKYCQIDDHDMILIIFQGRPLVLIICVLISILTVLSILTAVSSLTVGYPNVVLTVVFIPTVVYILTVVSSLSDCSQQHHNPHSYLHVIFISAYPAVRVKIYAYENMLRQKWLQMNSLFAGKESNRCSLQLREGRMTAREGY